MDEVELTIKLGRSEIALFREAITRAAKPEDWKTAAVLLLQSLRQRRGRFQVRELGKDYYNAAV